MLSGMPSAFVYLQWHAFVIPGHWDGQKIRDSHSMSSVVDLSPIFGIVYKHIPFTLRYFHSSLLSGNHPFAPVRLSSLSLSFVLPVFYDSLFLGLTRPSIVVVPYPVLES